MKPINQSLEKQMTPTESQLITHAKNNQAVLQAMSSRLARMESRLTQLMLFQGMQTDGRSQLATRESFHVA